MQLFSTATQKLRQSYHQAVRKDGERAADTMIGTMIGVLFLAILTSSFIGLFMSYNIMSTKAKVNNQLFSYISSENATSLNNNILDAPVDAYAKTTNAGWTATVHPAHPTMAKRVPLGNVIATANMNPKYTNFLYAAKKTVNGQPVSQWGTLVQMGPENGMLYMYTAVPKAGKKNVTCDWTERNATNFQNNCLVSFQSTPSVVKPPQAYTVKTGVDWMNYVRQGRWTTSPDFRNTTARSVKTSTSKIGTVSVLTSANSNPILVESGQRKVRVTATLSNLKDKQVVAFDLKQGGKDTLLTTKTVTANSTGNEGPANLTRTVQFEMTIPQAITTVDVFIDTDVLQTDDTKDPTIQLSKFFFYQTVPAA